MEDYTLMAEKGKAIDPERLKKLAGKVKGQVQRADGIVPGEGVVSDETEMRVFE